jgi:hypothetical protein
VALFFALLLAAGAGSQAGGFAAGASPDPGPSVSDVRTLPETAEPATVGSSTTTALTTFTAPKKAGSVTRAADARTVALAPPPTRPAPTPAYQGRNHVWIPALRIDRRVAAFPCSRTTPPGNSIYRWGCAGRNNVYLLAHAATAFKPLHKAYVNGKLRKGMRVHYADNAGRVRTYKVSFWKVVSPGGAEWAYAAQSKPSMTLQTCVGPDSSRRLIVRLVEV